MYRDTNKQTHTQKTTSQKHLFIAVHFLCIFELVIFCDVTRKPTTEKHKVFCAHLSQPLTKMHITELCIDDIE